MRMRELPKALYRGGEIVLKTAALAQLVLVLEGCAVKEKYMVKPEFGPVMAGKLEKPKKAEIKERVKMSELEGEKALRKKVFSSQKEAAAVYEEDAEGQGFWQFADPDQATSEVNRIKVKRELFEGAPRKKITMYHTHPSDRATPYKSETISAQDLTALVRVVLHFANTPNVKYFEEKVIVPSGVFTLKFKPEEMKKDNWQEESEAVAADLMMERIRGQISDNGYGVATETMVPEENVRLNEDLAKRYSRGIFSLGFEPFKD